METKLDLTDFIRYVLTGTNFLLFDVLLPLGFVAPSLLVGIVSAVDFLGLAAAATALGFLLDMVKFYQLFPGYRARKDSFMDELASALEVPPEHASTYFSFITKLSRRAGSHNLARRHAEWVLTVHTALAFSVASIIWAGILLRQLLLGRPQSSAWIPVVAFTVSAALAVRLFLVGRREREKSRQEYILFAHRNRVQIEDAWMIQARNGRDESPDSD